MSPVLRRVDIPPGDVGYALKRLQYVAALPDGTELTCTRSIDAFGKQLAAGYYHRLEFINGETPDEILAWFAMVDHARVLGVL